jgi:hypothetical protein
VVNVDHAQLIQKHLLIREHAVQSDVGLGNKYCQTVTVKIAPTTQGPHLMEEVVRKQDALHLKSF